MGPDSSQGFNGGQKSPLSPTKDSVREKSDGILQDLRERRRGNGAQAPGNEKVESRLSGTGRRDEGGRGSGVKTWLT